MADRCLSVHPGIFEDPGSSREWMRTARSHRKWEPRSHSGRSTVKPVLFRNRPGFPAKGYFGPPILLLERRKCPQWQSTMTALSLLEGMEAWSGLGKKYPRVFVPKALSAPPPATSPSGPSPRGQSRRTLLFSVSFSFIFRFGSCKSLVICSLGRISFSINSIFSEFQQSSWTENCSFPPKEHLLPALSLSSSASRSLLGHISTSPPLPRERTSPFPSRHLKIPPFWVKISSFVRTS